MATLFLDPNFKTPLTYEWNLDTQYEIASHWVLEVAYVGSRSVNQYPGIPFIYNAAQITSNNNPYYGINTNSVGNAPYRVPFLGFAATGVTAFCSCTDTKFNSLQATMRKQFSHGLTMQAAYTWSRDLTDTSYVAYDNPGPGNWGPAAQYHPHRLTINYSYNLPFGNHQGLLDKLTSGWSVAGVTIVQDGTPLTPTDTKAERSTAHLRPPRLNLQREWGRPMRVIQSAVTTRTVSDAPTQRLVQQAQAHARVEAG